MTAKPKDLPFVVNREDARSLLDQVTDGLREAIVCGYYATGDVLPSSHELVPMLGVSRIVTKNALARLAAEGYITSRVGVRSVVRDRREKQWRGHVLFVVPDCDDNYLQAILAGTLRDRLLSAGYLFSQVCVRLKSDGKYDFSHLDAALSRSVNLVITLFNSDDIFRFLQTRKVPFVVCREIAGMPDGAIGFMNVDRSKAARDFAEKCLAIGATKVVEIAWDSYIGNVSLACRQAGIEVERLEMPVAKSMGRLLRVKSAGFEAFSRLIADWNRNHPGRRFGSGEKGCTVYFIDDDYLATGAFLAMARAGLDVPGDIRLATWANTGLGPFFDKELSRIELDPAAAGEKVASAALEYLATGNFPSGTIEPRWIDGETLL